MRTRLSMPAGAVVLVLITCFGLGLGPSSSFAGPFDDPGHLPGEMAAWATSVDDFFAGPVDIAQPELGNASFGLPSLVLGASVTGGGAGAGDVFTLGDGGFITLHFADGIADGLGNDFAVFENGFVDQGSGLFFGEFAFVEVSTDGIDFARFPSTSLQPTPISTFGVLDPTDYDNLAGDQMIGVGTGFDLHELQSHPLVQDTTIALTDIRYVRLIDVIGDGSTLDDGGMPIYDPYATAFAAGGFDAEAVGVLNTVPEPGATVLLAIGTLGLVGLTPRSGRRTACATAR